MQKKFLALCVVAGMSVISVQAGDENKKEQSKARVTAVVCANMVASLAGKVYQYGTPALGIDAVVRVAGYTPPFAALLKPVGAFIAAKAPAAIGSFLVTSAGSVAHYATAYHTVPLLAALVLARPAYNYCKAKYAGRDLSFNANLVDTLNYFSTPLATTTGLAIVLIAAKWAGSKMGVFSSVAKS